MEMHWEISFLFSLSRFYNVIFVEMLQPFCNFVLFKFTNRNPENYILWSEYFPKRFLFSLRMRITVSLGICDCFVTNGILRMSLGKHLKCIKLFLCIHIRVCQAVKKYVWHDNLIRRSESVLGQSNLFASKWIKKIMTKIIPFPPFENYKGNWNC